MNQSIVHSTFPIDIGPTARDTLQEFIDIDVTAGDLVRILHRNQAYKSLFALFVHKKIGEKQEEPDEATHRLIGLLGMIGSRNLILSLRLCKALQGKFPVTEEGVDIQASEFLKTALDLEDLFIRNEWDYAETAYALGYYFDWISRTATTLPYFKKLEPYFLDISRRAQRTCIIAFLLAQKVHTISPKAAMAAGYFSQMGRLHMAIHFAESSTNYPETEAKLAKLPVLARVLQEKQLFGVLPEELGAYSLFSFGLFKDLFNAIRFYREPYLLSGVDPVQKQLASLVLLAESMAISWRTPADEKDPILQEWLNPWTGLKVSPASLIEVARTAMQVK